MFTTLRGGGVLFENFMIRSLTVKDVLLLSNKHVLKGGVGSAREIVFQNGYMAGH